MGSPAGRRLSGFLRDLGGMTTYPVLGRQESMTRRLFGLIVGVRLPVIHEL